HLPRRLPCGPGAAHQAAARRVGGDAKRGSEKLVKKKGRNGLVSVRRIMTANWGPQHENLGSRSKLPARGFPSGCVSSRTRVRSTPECPGPLRVRRGNGKGPDRRGGARRHGHHY